MITKYHKKIASYAIYNQLLASECFIKDKKKLNLTVEWGIRLYDLFSLPKVLMRDYRLLTITKLEQPFLQIDPNTGNYFTTPLFLYRLLNYAITKGSLFLVDTNDVGVFEAYMTQDDNQKIESRLSVVDKMEESSTQSLQQAEALRQSILKKTFSGELD